MSNAPHSEIPRWRAYKELFAVVQQKRKNCTRAALIDALNEDARTHSLPTCTYDKRSTEYWEAEPKRGARSSTPRPLRLEHLHKWLTEQIEAFGLTSEYAARLAAIAPRSPVVGDVASLATPQQTPKAAPRSECVTFGSIPTTWRVIEGDGVAVYASEGVRTFYNATPIKLPKELKLQRAKIERQMLKSKAAGLPFHHNGQRYAFERFVRGDTDNEDYLTISLHFRPSDYYTFLATNQSLNELIGSRGEKLRDKYFKDYDWTQPKALFANSFCVYLALITANGPDGTILFAQRGNNVGSRPGQWNISINEGVDKRDAKPGSGAPDIFHSVLRGAPEELGPQLNGEIRLLSFGVDEYYSHWAMVGFARSSLTLDEILEHRSVGVKDKWENARLVPVPFNPTDVARFVFARHRAGETWAPGALCCIYHSLINQYGKSETMSAIGQAGGGKLSTRK